MICLQNVTNTGIKKENKITEREVLTISMKCVLRWHHRRIICHQNNILLLQDQKEHFHL